MYEIEFCLRGSYIDMEDIAMSSSTVTPDNLHNLNEVFAANLATTFPATPKRPTPNSAKKRRQMPVLSRPTASPGHGVKMSMMFHDAAASLQGSRLPTYQLSSSIKRSRLPLSQNGSIKFGSTCQDDNMLLSGLGSPSKTSQYLEESCKPDWAETSRHRASGLGQNYPTSKPVTKAGPATIGTLTNQRLGAATLRIGRASLPLQIDEEDKEPNNNGLLMPAAPTPGSVEDPEELKYPILESWRSPWPSSNASIIGSDSDDVHSTHGVPFVMPFPHSDAKDAPRSDIDTWLNRIVEATTFGTLTPPKQCHGTEDLRMIDAPISRSIAPNVSSPVRPRVFLPKLRQGLQSVSGASSNKENISPSKCSSSPTRPPAQYLQSRIPSRFRQTTTHQSLQHTKGLHFDQPVTPQGHFSLPPKSKRARVKGNSTSGTKTEMLNARRDFTVHEDQLAEALAQLSPDVERHRKGRGPKRERCMSYWDEDILQVDDDDDDHGEAMVKGKQVLGESKQVVELTTERPFVKVAEFASFEFKA